ncbi:MAG: S8 family serine peptidase [Conexivisphaerales archaeon]
MKLSSLMLLLLIATSAFQVAHQSFPSAVSDSHSLAPSAQVSFSIFFPPSSASNTIKVIGSDRFTSVENYLQSLGFSIVYSSPLRYLLTISGEASLVERLFSVNLLTAKASQGIYYYPSSPLIIPSQLSGLRIFGLTNRSIFTPQYVALARVNQSGFYPADIPRSIPFPTKGSLQFSATYYSPSVFQQAYNETPLLQNGYEGQGQTIAIIDAYGDPTIYQDLQSFDRQFNLPAAQLQIIPIGSYQPEQGIGTGWDVETALDVEAAHMMAPYAKIVLLVANGNNINNGLFDAIDKVVTEHLANITSMSWGAPENLFAASGFFASGFDNYPFSEFYFALGSSEGISFFAASGDLGANGGTPSKFGGVTYPSSSPFVTSVGGTTLFVRTLSGDVRSSARVEYAGEAAWSSSPQYLGATVSSGGGESSFFSTPFYQKSFASGHREVPDISADANPYTGAIIVYEGQQVAIGGTSLATPILAGMTSLLDQSLNSRLGLLNPYLYSSDAFNKVSFGYNNGYYASSSYNMVTGLGSPNLGMLRESLNNINSLKINVSTSSSASSSSSYPQYPYGSPFEITATVTDPYGSQVTSGYFYAAIYTPKGLLTNLSMSYNGIYWVANYTPKIADPPNAWQIVVSGRSGSYSGIGYYSLDIGLSVNIISPVPYPYAPPLIAGEPFAVEAIITNPDGSPVTSGSFTATFYQNGKAIYSAPLFPVGNNGTYEGSAQLVNPQGTCIMNITGYSGQQIGYAYTYEYVGEAILDAAIITPIDEAIPTAYPGQTITLVAATLTGNGTGLFDSNISATFVNPQGQKVASVQLYPSPSTTQYGTLNLFGFHQANFTVPSYFSPGFYSIEFNSSYQSQSSVVQSGYYNTSIYISASSLNLTYSTPVAVVEGQNVNIQASIYYPNGTEVKSGVFMAELNPSALDYAQNLVAAQTGVPMQYDVSSGLWKASYTIPTEFDQGFYKGVPQFTLAGGWSLAISGESSDAMQAQHSSYFTVLPYTLLNTHDISPGNVESINLASYSNGLLHLSYIGADTLVIRDMQVSIDSSLLKGLTLINCTGVISNSVISGISLVNSSINLNSDAFENSYAGVTANYSYVQVADSQFRNLTYAFMPYYSLVKVQNSSTAYIQVTNISTLAQPTTPQRSLTIQKAIKQFSLTIYGSQLSVDSVSIDGNPVNFTQSPEGNNSIILTVPFDSQKQPDGVYQMQVLVASGIQYQLVFQLLNIYHQSSYQTLLTALTLSSILLALAAIVISVTRKGKEVKMVKQAAEPQPTT